MGDALDFDVGIHEQGLGTLHTDFLYISIDSAAVAALKEFGQVFLGKEIFIGKHGDFDVGIVVFIQIFFYDLHDLFGRGIVLSGFPGKVGLRIASEQGFFDRLVQFFADDGFQDIVAGAEFDGGMSVFKVVVTADDDKLSVRKFCRSLGKKF